MSIKASAAKAKPKPKIVTSRGRPRNDMTPWLKLGGGLFAALIAINVFGGIYAQNLVDSEARVVERLPSAGRNSVNDLLAQADARRAAAQSAAEAARHKPRHGR